MGIVLAMLAVPALSDIFGRKNVFCWTMVLQIIGQYGLIVSENLTQATVYMIISGATWPGKRITGLNYMLEFIPDHL